MRQRLLVAGVLLLSCGFASAQKTGTPSTVIGDRATHSINDGLSLRRNHR